MESLNSITPKTMFNRTITTKTCYIRQKGPFSFSFNLKRGGDKSAKFMLNRDILEMGKITNMIRIISEKSRNVISYLSSFLRYLINTFIQFNPTMTFNLYKF